MPRHSGVEGNIATSKSKIIWPFLRQKNTLPWNPLCPSWYKPWSLCSCLEDFLSKCQMSLRQKHLGGALPWVQGFVHFSSWLIYFTHLPFPCISWLFWGTIPLLNKTCWLKSMTSCDKSCAWENLGLSGWGEFLLRKPTHPWGPDSNRWRQSTLWCIWKQHSRKKKKHVVRNLGPTLRTFVWCLCCGHVCTSSKTCTWVFKHKKEPQVFEQIDTLQDFKPTKNLGTLQTHTNK